MLQDKLCTVKICDGHGDYIVINESDFDADKHDLYQADKPAATADDLKEGSVAWYKAELTARGVEIPQGAKKGDLKALYEANQD